MKTIIVDMYGSSPAYTAELFKSLYKRDSKKVFLLIGRAAAIESGICGSSNVTTSQNTAHRIQKLPKIVRIAVKLIELAWDFHVLSRLIKYTEAGVLHVQWVQIPFVESPVYFIIKKVYGVKIVFTRHNMDAGHGQTDIKSGILRFGLRLMMELSDRVILHVVETRDQLVIRLPHMKSKLKVVPHGPLHQNPNPKVQDRHSRGTTLKFLMFGNISRYKNLELLLEAAKICAGRFCFKVTVVGSPKYDISSILKKNEDLIRDGVLCIEPRRVKSSEIVKLFTDSDVFVLPYSSVDSSGVLLTAIGYEKPIIVSRLPGFLEVLGNNYPLTFTKGDSIELSNLMSGLTCNAIYEFYCKEIRRVKEYLPNWDTIAEQTLQIYLSDADD